jgi:hypothetical protein
MVFFFGAMRIDAFRPIGARAVAFLLPLGVIWQAVSKLDESHPLLRRSAQLLGLCALVASEMPAARLFFGFEPLPLSVALLRYLLLALGLTSVVLEGVAAHRSLRARVTAWFGIALAFGAYLAGVGQIDVKKQFGQVLVAAVIGLWGGGLSGLVLGAAAAKVAKAPLPAAAAGKAADKPPTALS